MLGRVRMVRGLMSARDRSEWLRRTWAAYRADLRLTSKISQIPVVIRER